MTTLEARPCLFPLCCRAFILVAAGRKWLRLAFISSDFYHDDDRFLDIPISNIIPLSHLPHHPHHHDPPHQYPVPHYHAPHHDDVNPNYNGDPPQPCHPVLPGEQICRGKPKQTK